MIATTEKPLAEASEAVSRGTPPRWLHARRLVFRSLLMCVGGVAVLMTLNWWLSEGRFIESTDNAYVQGDIAVLSPRIDGEVSGIAVSDNQPVHAGDPLILLDPKDWQARVDQARAALLEAEAAVTTAWRQITEQQFAIEAAQATIANAQAEQSRAAGDASRAATLFASGWLSRQANEKAIADKRKASAMLAAATAQEEVAEQQLSVFAAQAMQAEARRQNAQAAVTLAQNNLAYTVIRAPFDGIVARRAAQLGEHVVAGSQLIAVAPMPTNYYVIANFKETQLRRMHPGMKVNLIPDIRPDATMVGSVDSLAPATGALFSLLPPENATGNFTKVVQRVPVKLRLDRSEAEQASWLRAGLSVTAEVDTRGPGAKRLGLFGFVADTLRQMFL